MQLLLGLCFFSIFLAAGNSLTCEVCNALSSDCSGPKADCPGDKAVCMTVKSEVGEGDKKIQTTVKSCSSNDFCKTVEKQKGKPSTSQIPNVPANSLLKEVICSKAPPSFATFFPAFLGLLLMKLLF